MASVTRKTRRVIRKAIVGPTVAPAPSKGEIGATGLRQWSGYIREEFLTELQGDRSRKVFREMADNDATIGGLFSAVTWLARQVKWRFEADDEEGERSEFLESCRLDMAHAWEDLIAELLRGMLTFGWSFHELVYKLRTEQTSAYPDGRIGWAKLPIRAQESLLHWQFSTDGTNTLEALIQLPPPEYRQRTIPMDRGLLFRTESIKDNPEGRSLLRNAYRSWYLKKHIENIEGVGIERDLAGLPVIYAPALLFDPSATGAQQSVLTELKNIVTNIRRDEQEGVVLPMAYDESGHPLYKLELLASGGDRQINSNEIINRYDSRILMTCLAQFLMLGQEKVGSFALSSDQTNLFAVGLGSLLDNIAAPFNTHAIPQLLALNGMETADAPRLVHGDIETPDLAKLGTFLTAMTNAGAPLFPDLKLENKLREVAGLPVLSQEEADERDMRQGEEAAARMENQIAVMEAQPATQPSASPPVEKVQPAPARAAVDLNVNLRKDDAPPVINVAPPIVNVAAAPVPVVHVAPAQVTVQAPEVHVTAPPADLSGVERALGQQTETLQAEHRETRGMWGKVVEAFEKVAGAIIRKKKVIYRDGRPVGVEPEE